LGKRSGTKGVKDEGGFGQKDPGLSGGKVVLGKRFGTKGVRGQKEVWGKKIRD